VAVPLDAHFAGSKEGQCGVIPEMYCGILSIHSPRGSRTEVLFELTYRRGWRAQHSQMVVERCDYLVEQKAV
jgi:hypothetical protein